MLRAGALGGGLAWRRPVEGVCMLVSGAVARLLGGVAAANGGASSCMCMQGSVSSIVMAATQQGSNCCPVHSVPLPNALRCILN